MSKFKSNKRRPAFALALSILTTFIIPFTSSDGLAARAISSIDQFLDQTLQDAMATSPFRPLVTTALGCDPKQIAFSLGTSARASDQIAHDLCSSHLVKGSMKKLGGYRHYNLIFNEDGRFPLTGWTGFDNMTTLVLHHVRMSQDQLIGQLNADAQLRLILIQTLLHETAIYFDDWQRPMLSSADKFNIPQLGAEKTRELSSLMSHPALRTALAAARAFQIEEQTLRELAVARPDLYAYPKMQYVLIRKLSMEELKCAEFVQTYLNVTYDQIKAISRNTPWLDIESGSFRVGIDETLSELLGNHGIVKRFFAISLTPTGAPAQSACNYLATPHLGNDNSSATNGPRPYVTGGGSGD